MTVGFAAESQNLLENALSKLQRKGLDFLLANDITASDAGFASDTNRVILVDRDGTQETLELMSKSILGELIMVRIAQKLSET